MSELRDYVVDEVHRLTRDAQTPTSRRVRGVGDDDIYVVKLRP